MLLASVSCNITKSSSFNPNSKYSPAELRQDFSILNKVLKANHPSLYWYSTEDSVNNAFAKTYNSLNDSLTQQQFRRRVAWVINKIHCGHTVVRPSKAYIKYYSKQKVKIFPFYLKVWADSAIVMNNLMREDSTIKRGMAILTINGLPIKQILDSMCTLISSDGYSNIFKYQLISFNFPAFY